MNNSQYPILKAALLADTDPDVQAAVSARNDTEIARLYNLDSSFIVFKKWVELKDIGEAVNYVAVEAMTDANRGRITTFYTMNPSGFSPSRSDMRDYWANTFSGALGGQGANTRAALEALWRRPATRAEAVFATGTGTTANPGELVFEGTITINDVGKALNLS